MNMKKFWALFFIFWPTVALYYCWIAPSRNWWFPVTAGSPEGHAMTPLGERIDGLFYLILGIVTVVFIGTQYGHYLVSIVLQNRLIQRYVMWQIILFAIFLMRCPKTFKNK